MVNLVFLAVVGVVVNKVVSTVSAGVAWRVCEETDPWSWGSQGLRFGSNSSVFQNFSSSVDRHTPAMMKFPAFVAGDGACLSLVPTV